MRGADLRAYRTNRDAVSSEPFPRYTSVDGHFHGHDRDALLEEAEAVLVKNGVVKDGDLIVVSFGEPIGKSGGTNTMKIVKVGEHRRAD